MKQLFVRVSVLSSILITSSLLLSCNEQKAVASKPIRHVEVQNIKLSDLLFSYDYPGVLQGVVSYNVISRVSGVVDKQLYVEGNKVESGQALYEIDPRPYKLALDEANARLIKDNTQVENYKKILDRYIKLYTSGAVSKQELETAEINYDNARSLLSGDQANANQAKLNLTYTKVIAPSTGYIGQRNVSIGDTVTAMQTVLNKISSENSLYLLFSIPENDRLSINQNVAQKNMSIPKDFAFTLDAELANGQLLQNVGIVTFKDSQLDPTTGVWSLRANVYESKASNFISGQYIHVYLNGAKYINAVYIPQEAVLFDNDGPFVFTVDSVNKVVKKSVQTGRMSDTSWAITKGLASGDKVIIVGAATVGESELVQVDQESHG